ncbi:MAG TPA: hypothetical protein VKC60_06770, partial [Opitutaceae bacterium]|nr:hypothetical protein [Opitutaceae bacterium]
DPAAHYRSAEDRSVYRYMWQKQWAWYFAWGRLGFNPALSEKTLIQAYEQHFGGAGKTIYAAMQQASVVVPLVYAYRFPGPDHRDFSPETETGNLSAKRKNKISFLLQFIDNHPEDERSFAGIGSFVDAKLASQPDGRVSPLAVSMHLSDAAKATQELINTVPPLKGQAANEWRLMKTDLLSASWLGEYHARRITAMVYLGYALKTGREHDYSTAVQGLATSREAWKKLSETADAVYRPLSNPLRKQLDFQWGAQLESIEKLDATASELWAQHASQDDARPLVVTAADRGWDAGVRVEKLDHELTADKNHVTIRCHASTRTGVAKVVLWYKALPSQLAWQSVDMDALPDGSFAAKPDLTPEGLMYLVEVQSEDRQAENFPSVFKETPYRIIPAFAAKP